MGTAPDKNVGLRCKNSHQFFPSTSFEDCKLGQITLYPPSFSLLCLFLTSYDPLSHKHTHTHTLILEKSCKKENMKTSLYTLLNGNLYLLHG